MDPSTRFVVGSVFGTYRLDARLGEGGMGIVYRATDERFGRPVAIKFLRRHTDEGARDRFRREVQTAAALNHPHLVSVFDVGEVEGCPYIVTELIDGGTLSEWAAAASRSPADVLDLLVGVVDGLAMAHEAGLVHRDVKPANILVSRAGFAKLADFGLAKLVDPGEDDRTASAGLTRDGVVVGTIAYMSPEQASGAPVDARSDVFAVGVVLHELLSHRHPFAGSTGFETIERVKHQPAPPLGPEVPPVLQGIVAKALEKAPADRNQSLRDMLVDLRRASRQTTEQVIVPPRPTRTVVGRVAAAVAIALAGMAAGAWWHFRGGVASQAPIHSVAVLPLQNLSADPSQEFFSDGTTEALIADLAQIHAIDVTSRTSVMRYKGASKSVPQIGRELGVDAIVSGSVQRSGGRVRVTAELIRTATDTHVWAQAFDRDAKDILDLESEIATTISQQIRAAVTTEESAELAAAHTVNPAAHEAYLLGRFNYVKDTEAGNREAVTDFQDAIRLDPNFADAHASLSLALGALYDQGASKTEGARRSEALTAIALDNRSALAHAAMAGVYSDSWAWADADREWKLAMSINPDSVDTCACYANFLAFGGRSPEAIALIEHAVKVNPLSADVQVSRSLVYYLARRYEEAVRFAQRASELAPESLLPHIMIARASNQLGRYDASLAALAGPELSAATVLGSTYAGLGRRAEALNVAASAYKRGSELAEVAEIYFDLGEMEKGFRILAEAIDRHQPGAARIAADPIFDRVRDDARFRAQLARVQPPG